MDVGQLRATPEPGRATTLSLRGRHPILKPLNLFVSDQNALPEGGSGVARACGPPRLLRQKMYRELNDFLRCARDIDFSMRFILG